MPKWCKRNINLLSFNIKKIEINNTWQRLFNHSKENIMEYPLIILFIISGGVFLISTNDLITIFLSIELQSYGLYLLSTIYRNSELSTAGGLIYFLLGGFSSSLILLGISLLYINSGTTNMDNIYIITSISNIWDHNYNYINVSLFIFSLGFLFKISAAPFHFWSPDVYDSIPTVVTIFVAIIAKISIFIFLLGLVFYTNIYLNYNNNLSYILLISSLFSLIVGTFLGITQFRIKKLLAYSTISHIGFLLLALNICNIESIQAFIFYLIQYSFTSLNAFMILLIMGLFLFYFNIKNKHNSLLDETYSPLQLISQLKGFFFINPLLSLSFAITIFSFAGIPPLMGFFAKQMVLSAAINSSFIFITFIAIITSVIGGVYYLNIIKEIFFNNSDYSFNSFKILIKSNLFNKNKILIDNNLYTSLYIPSPVTFTISTITLIIIFFIFINKEW
jgi:NADH-ubiquinone oxidoreductase chain 2